MPIAKGRFSVQLTPIFKASGTPDPISAMRIAKQYRGPLVATGAGTMLSSFGHEKGSAGYVAMEEVHGHLEGRVGSFVLQHFGIMSASEKGLQIRIVPDSGTGDLTGIAGEMDIRIEKGIRHYTLTYTL